MYRKQRTVDIQIESAKNNKKNIQKKKKNIIKSHQKQARLASFHNEPFPARLVCSLSFFKHTKCLYRSPWFCRNNHPHGWDDTEEKTEKKHKSSSTP